MFQASAFQNNAFQTIIIVEIVADGYDYLIAWQSDIINWTMLPEPTTIISLQMMSLDIRRPA